MGCAILATILETIYIQPKKVQCIPLKQPEFSFDNNHTQTTFQAIQPSLLEEKKLIWPIQSFKRDIERNWNITYYGSQFHSTHWMHTWGPMETKDASRLLLTIPICNAQIIIFCEFSDFTISPWRVLSIVKTLLNGDLNSNAK